MEIDALYEDHHDALYRYLARFCGDPELAADACQEAFVRYADRPPAEDTNLRAWLFTVATRVVRDRVRTRKRRSELLHARPDRAPVGEPSVDPEERLLRSERRRAVRAALDALNERERTVLLMREEGFRHREIAAAVGTTTGSVGTMIARALEKLARALPADLEGVP